MLARDTVTNDQTISEASGGIQDGTKRKPSIITDSPKRYPIFRGFRSTLNTPSEVGTVRNLLTWTIRSMNEIVFEDSETFQQGLKRLEDLSKDGAACYTSRQTVPVFERWCSSFRHVIECALER